MNPSPAVSSPTPWVRGKLTADAPVGRHTWVGTGGAADMLFEPADGDECLRRLSSRPTCVSPGHRIGGGANTLVRDGGIP